MCKRKKFTHEERAFIAHRDHYRCCRCNLNMIKTPSLWVLDHKLPLSKGGSNRLTNIQLLCRSCDQKKSDSILPTVMEDYIHARLKELFRKDRNRIKIYS